MSVVSADRRASHVHIITCLDSGGAERALDNLLKKGLAGNYQVTVVSLTDEGYYGPKLRERGVPVYCLRMKHGFPSFRALLSLRRIIKNCKPDVIQGWMYHGNLVASLVRRFSPRRSKVVWNVRQCLYDLNNENVLTQWVILACKVISKKPNAIIYNSALSRSQHEALGFFSKRGLVIANGFEVDRFVSSKIVRDGVRRELSLPQDCFVFGHVGRYHPMKDHTGFLKAAAIVLRRDSSAVFILAGKNVDDKNVQIIELIPEEQRSHFLFLGERSDVQRLYNAMDVFCLSSSSEAFPNVLGEAMSSSLPCITTDVGDAAHIVGETGLVVPPKDPGAIASAMLQMLDTPAEIRRAFGQAARLRVEEEFNLISVVDMYAELYDSLI